MNKEEIKINCTNDVFKYSADEIYDVIYDLQQRIDKIMEIIELNQYSYGYQIKDETLGGKE